MRDLPKFDNPDLIVGAEDFADAGVFRLRDDLLIVQSLDFFPPLVDDPYVYGQIAAANSLSDIYAMGARPQTALNIVGFPDDQLELTVLNEILRGGADRVLEAGAVICGGHTVRDTEIKYGLSATGIVSPESLMMNSTAQPGDSLVLTKPLGTGFITTAFKAGRCAEDVLQAACDSMIQLNRAASEAAQACAANAVTDITGFGLAGHASEMANASNVTMSIELSKLPVLSGAADLAARGNKTRASATNRSFSAATTQLLDGLDALQSEFLFDAQTSGGLLISVPEQHAEELVRQARDRGAEATCIIGRVEPRQQETSLIVHP